MKAKIIITLIATVLFGALGYRFGCLLSVKSEMMSGIAYACDNLFNLNAHVGSPTTEDQTMLLFGSVILFAMVPFLVFYLCFVMPRQQRYHEEHGSARWAKTSEMRKFANNESPDDNIIFTKHAKLATKKKGFDLKTDRNLNLLVVGGSGSGKTRYVVKPNLMQLNGSYVLTDPKGTCLNEVGHLFEDNGYTVKSFNTIDMEASNYWNPLQYVKTDADILSFVNCLIANTNGEGKPSDPFWENSERLLYTALIAYLRDWCSPEDYTIPNLIYLLTLAKVEEDNENYESPLDLLFKEIETGRKYGVRAASAAEEQQVYDEWNRGLRGTETPTDWDWVPSRKMRKDGLSPYLKGGIDPNEDYALLHYHNFKQAAGKTLKSIIISCNVRLEPFAISSVSRILSGPLDEYGVPTARCELEIDKMGDPNTKTILFGIISDTDKTFAFMLAILMWQTINALCLAALDRYGGKLPTLVNFVIDEFANIGKLPDIEQTIAVTRSRNIALTIILQSIAQLENNYTAEAAKIIRGNCDTQLFLGKTDHETNKEISEALGKETIFTKSYSQSKGTMANFTTSSQMQQRDLMDPAEVGLVPPDQALCLIKGSYPYKDRKYILEEHPRYEYIDPGHPPVKKGGKMTPAAYEKEFDFKEYLEKQRKESLLGNKT